MRGLVLCAITLLGCANNGVVVEVDTNGLVVSSVELVISNRLCQHPDQDGDCASIQGQGFGVALGAPGDLYARDASAITGELVDGKAVFELPESGNTIEMAFALGRDDNGTIVGSAVMADTLDPSSGPRRYRVTLDPTEELRGPTKSPGMAAAAQWGGGNQCVGVEPIQSTLEVQRPIFILPKDDPDCDGRRDGEECDPLWFDGISFDEAAAVHCVQPKNDDPAEPCLLGHVPTCIENPANSSVPSCIQSAVCLPSTVCASCAPLDEACQQDKLAAEPGDIHISCPLPGEEDVVVGQASECGGNNEFVLQPLDNIPLGVTCQFAELVEMKNLALHSPRSTTFTEGDASFEILQVDPSCAIRMKWQGTFPIAEVAHTVLVITVDAGGKDREIWIPINFQPGAVACTATGVACTYSDDGDIDTIALCAQ